jgi:ubiquitin-like modifier-activating enzyme ATG7
VELLVAMLHSPLLDSTPADTPGSGSLPNEANPVGLVPHQIRGFVSSYATMLIAGHAYDKCTACSPAVLNGYRADPFGFVAKACASGSFLEDLTGLTEMKNEKVEWEVEPVSDEDAPPAGGDDFSMD